MPLFCMPCKKTEFHGTMETQFKWGGIKLVREGLEQAAYMLYMKKTHVCKEKLSWLWCEQVCQIWHSWISSKLCCLKCSISQSGERTSMVYFVFVLFFVVVFFTVVALCNPSSNKKPTTCNIEYSFIAQNYLYIKQALKENCG